MRRTNARREKEKRKRLNARERLNKTGGHSKEREKESPTRIKVVDGQTFRDPQANVCKLRPLRPHWRLPFYRGREKGWKKEMALVRGEKARGKEKEQETVRSTIVRVSKRNTSRRERTRITIRTKYNKMRKREREKWKERDERIYRNIEARGRHSNDQLA